MKIALIGGTGFVGSAVLAELSQRGHQVTALARDTTKYRTLPGVTPVLADATDAAQVERAVAGVDAVISAYNPGWHAPDLYARFMAGTRGVLSGTERAGVKRLLVVGGAGSLLVAPGVQLMDTPEFASLVPAEIIPGVQGARDALTLIRAETALEWTFLSPPAKLAPGERTGQFRIGGDDLLMNGAEPAGISVADLAVAIVDEIEHPAHIRRRFTVAY
jgi:putative NADH-flavin reductase